MKHTLFPWERGVRFDRGVLVGELGPGQHRLSWRRSRLHRVDIRPRTMTPAAQDVPTSDGVLVRVTVVVRWAVSSATKFVVESAAPEDELYTAVQLALRGAVLTRAHSAVDAERGAIASEVLAAVAARAGELGVTVSDVAVRDVVMPGELRRAALAELVAASEGRAALERARGETAALRSLLNAARLAEEHPALLELRALQAASTVVVDRPGRRS
ncbi:SPFH domain/Band 7 family protein [Lentzea atacamensis]|uniref:SPFH domain/Band 7 family protein n=1 Tax=Lentzea atacamensis TaxID=531938 RepID=A0ABX9E3I5_9PSEU|nr:slipin family protein [Lentzea atacamensis]RAS63316.1 SPFH domain/Band 7 family protein [Lentzea atacamensis]